MVTSPTGKGVIVMGGSSSGQRISKATFELTQSMEWTRLEQNLQINILASLAIPIPDELVSKQDSNDILTPLAIPIPDELTTWFQQFFCTLIIFIAIYEILKIYYILFHSEPIL